MTANPAKAEALRARVIEIAEGIHRAGGEVTTTAIRERTRLSADAVRRALTAEGWTTTGTKGATWGRP